MKQSRLSGKRYVNLVRCSTDQQADTSPVDQQRVLNLFAEEQGMIHAGEDVVLEGVSGSRPGARTDFDQVLLRKKEQDDFEVLLVQDVSRLTRVGPDHAGKLKYDLAAAGVEIVFIGQGTTGDPDLDALMQNFSAHSAQQQVKTMSYAVVRGQASSLEAGKIPHSFRIPFGVDRLYLGPDGGARHRIRNLPDGSQQMLDPESETVLAHYAPNPKRGESTHYKRQSDERIVLVPGEAGRVAMVRQIYRRRLVDGWGTYRIAMELNDSGARSADGGPWNQRSVKIILENPTYSGTGIASRYATGIFNIRGKDAAPAPVERDIQSIAKNRSFTRKLRPESEWRVKDIPLLANYLGDDLTESATEFHAKVLAKAAAKAQQPHVRQKSGGDKWADTPYVLKGLLHSKQGNHAMTGKKVGPKGSRRRYYTVTRGAATPTKGSLLLRLVPAETLERAILAAVRDALLDLPNLREIIKHHAKQQQDIADDYCPASVTALVAERDEIGARLQDSLMLGASSRKLMQKQFGQWESRLSQLERQIATANAATAPAKIDVEATADAVAAQLKEVAGSLDQLPSAALREVLGRLIPRLVVDLESREVEMEIALPPSVAAKGKGKGLCVVSTNCRLAANEAQRHEGLKIALVSCEQQIERRNTPCYVCRRRAA